MQVNKINGYYIPKTNFNNIKATKPISFGEEHWCGDSSAIENRNREYLNRRINKFVKDVKEFDKFSKNSIKYLKKSAQKVYAQGERTDFREEERPFDFDGDTYNISCSKNGSKKIAVLKNNEDKMVFIFNKPLNGKPKEYSIEGGEKTFAKEYYKLNVTPEKTVFVYKEADSSKIQKITYDKDGTVYKEKNSANSQSYESLIMKKFPHSFKPVYIENNGLSSEDIRYTYTYNPIKKDWSGVWESIPKN